MSKRAYAVDQRTAYYNAIALEKAGWEQHYEKWGGFDEEVFRKRWHIQDEQGGAYWITIMLRRHENVALVYVNNQWVGRALYVSEADAIAKAIKRNAR